MKRRRIWAWLACCGALSCSFRELEIRLTAADAEPDGQPPPLGEDATSDGTGVDAVDGEDGPSTEPCARLCQRVAATAGCATVAASCVSQCNDALAFFPACGERITALFTCGANTTVSCTATRLSFPECPAQTSAANDCVMSTFDSGAPDTAPMVDSGAPDAATADSPPDVGPDVGPDAAPDARAFDPTRACDGGMYAGTSRDCNWLPGRTFACTPGSRTTVGCNTILTDASATCTTALGSCSGDPVMRVCVGAASCSWDAALASADDTCGTCPVVTVVCPASGSLHVMTGNYSNTMAGTCNPAIR